jgi:hypothetical protein
MCYQSDLRLLPKRHDPREAGRGGSIPSEAEGKGKLAPVLCPEMFEGNECVRCFGGGEPHIERCSVKIG